MDSGQWAARRAVLQFGVGKIFLKRFSLSLKTHHGYGRGGFFIFGINFRLNLVSKSVVHISIRVEETGSGPGRLVLRDPDGNTILIDQHV